MNENPPLTAAALTSAADTVRTAAAREDRLAQHKAATDQWNAFRDAAKLSGEQIEEMARALLEAAEPTTITYTNRAARRARAKAERKHR